MLGKKRCKVNQCEAFAQKSHDFHLLIPFSLSLCTFYLSLMKHFFFYNQSINLQLLYLTFVFIVRLYFFHCSITRIIKRFFNNFKFLKNSLYNIFCQFGFKWHSSRKCPNRQQTKAWDRRCLYCGFAAIGYKVAGEFTDISLLVVADIATGLHFTWFGQAYYF